MYVPPVLQSACTKTGPEYLTDFEFIKAFTCTYVADLGFLTVGLIVWAAVSLAIYTRQGSAIIPVVLLFMFGGVVSSQIAGVGNPFVVLLVVLVPAGTFAYLYYRYSR